MLNKSPTSQIFLLVCFVANIVTLPSVLARSVATSNAQASVSNAEQTFIFSGNCPNGAMYRLLSYEQDVDGLSQSFYDYEGPAGKGTVRSNVAPKKLAVRVCHELADIQDGSKFD
jgi:hypothetical protein